MPENPKSIAFVDRSGEKSRGVHQLWFCDGEYVHMASGAADFVTHNQLDDQCYQIFDVRNPSAPKEVGRWWMPGTRVGDKAAAADAAQGADLDMGFRAHNTNVYPQRPDRCYLGYIDAGMYVLDITDKANPKPLCRWDNSPPYHGFTHTVLPLFDRNLFVVTDEFGGGRRGRLAEARVDSRRARRDQSGADRDLPAPLRRVRARGRALRRAQHPRERAAADLVALRHDHHRHFLQRRLARLRHFQSVSAEGSRHVRAARLRALAPRGTIQLNDVFVDERGIVYTVDRHVGGLYVLEMDF